MPVRAGDAAAGGGVPEKRNGVLDVGGSGHLLTHPQQPARTTSRLATSPPDALAQVCGDDGAPGMDGAEQSLTTDPVQVTGRFLENVIQRRGWGARDRASAAVKRPRCGGNR